MRCQSVSFLTNKIYKSESIFINFEKKISGLSKDTRSVGPINLIDSIKPKTTSKKAHKPKNMTRTWSILSSPSISTKVLALVKRTLSRLLVMQIVRMINLQTEPD